MFINYFKESLRDSPINLVFVRLLLSSYILWKVFSIEWRSIYEWPAPFLSNYTTYLLVSESVLILELGLLAVLTLLFGIGYRRRFAATGVGLILLHLGSVRTLLNGSGGTTALFIAGYFLIFYALLLNDDYLSVDTLRATSEKSLDELNRHLQSDSEQTSRMEMMKYALLVMGILYFGSSVGKIVNGPLFEWATGTNLGRFIAYRIPLYGYERPLAELVLSLPSLLWIGAIGAIILELGFLIAILLGIAIWPIVVSLIGFHIAIAVLVGPFFLDNIIFLCLFFAWDRAYSRIARTDSVDIVYDEHCYFCTQSLHLFPYLDINDTTTFYSQYTAPDRYRGRDDTDFESAMYLFRDDVAYHGYWAFRELLRQFTVFAPIVWAMGFSPIAAIGERVYQYIADNRGQHFTCSVDLSERETPDQS